MAPRTGGTAGAKRGVPAAAKSAPAKKAKQGAGKPKQDPLLSPVLELIEEAEDLNVSCKKMLLALAPDSLTTPADERHEVLSRIVAMIGTVVEGTRSKLQGSIDRETARVSEAEATKAAHEAEVEKAETLLTAAREVVETKEAARSEAQKTTAEKQAALDETKATQQRENAALDAAHKGKEDYEVAFREQFKALQEEELEPAKATALQVALLQFVKTINLDPSLLTSLPTACTKPPSQRGGFDNMVFQELEKELIAHEQKLTETITNGAPAAAARAEAVAAAQAALDAAEAAQKLATDALTAAEARRDECSAAASAAKAAVSKSEDERRQAAQARDVQVQTLEHFEKFNASCFAELRDRVAKPAAPAVAEAPAKEAPEAPAAVTVDVGGA
eukprot:TRINITY_DN48523_c0_g1_i1.p1 TRINITY_DN48523_c0_g1~~TRINITY_DN48523_c0_g1_i1.p1  ORF type:complete len:414 (-),score=167.04 TRINITY_DN48523_c0_g1_i1:112-1281(-)